jgi:putative membrane protein
MKMIPKILTGVVALEHIFFLVVEMFLWQKPLGLKMFDITPEFAAETAFMAQNQGLYNGFLAAGLIWALIAAKRDVRIFFLLCVIVAGIFGAITVSPSIFFVQAVPAIIALLLTLLARGSDQNA